MIGLTGATGFLGRQVLSYLIEEAPLRVLTRNEQLSNPSSVEYLRGDLTSFESAKRFTNGCNTIIHIAGVAHSSLKTEPEKNHAYAVNVEGTRNLIRASLQSGVKRFVLVSTAHVYANHGDLEIDEASPTSSTGSFYAQTKLLGEEIALQASKQGIEVVIARPCLIYGAGARFNLEQMMRGLDRGYYFHISDCIPKRSFLSLTNAARALCYLARSHVSPGTYNLADQLPYSLAEFVNDVADRMGRPRPRAIPLAMASALGTAGTIVQKFGIRAPFTNDSLAKLTSDFTLSTERLARARFTWDPDTGLARQEMVDHYIRSQMTGHN